MNASLVAKETAKVGHNLARFDQRRAVKEAVAETTVALPAPRVRTKTKNPAMRLSLPVFSAFVFAVSVLFFIVYSYMNMAVANAEYQAMKAELTALQRAERDLTKIYEETIDIKMIETYAVHTLGMVKPDGTHIIYVDLSGEDSVEIIKEKTIWDSIKGKFSGVSDTISDLFD